MNNQNQAVAKYESGATSIGKPALFTNAKIEKNKNQIIEPFPTYQEKVKALIDKEKLKFKSCKDVAHVLGYVESLP